MILAVPLPPTPGQVAVGVLGAIAGALIAAVSAFLAHRSHNWLNHLGTVGGLLILAGIVGQRAVADGTRLGAWDAGISVPVISVRLDPVAAGGIILALLGLTLTLLFERIVEEDARPRPLIHRPMEDDDAV